MEAIPQDKESFEATHYIQGGPSIKLELLNHQLISDAFIGSPLEKTSLSFSDKQFFKRLIAAAISDLLTRLAINEDGIKTETCILTPYLSWQLMLGDIPFLQIAFPKRYCIVRRRSLVPEAVMNKPEFKDVNEAIADTSILLDAEVGSLSLDLNKLSDLKVGDVLEFDRTLAEGFPLRVDGKACENLEARFVLTQEKKGARKRPGIILEYPHE